MHVEPHAALKRPQILSGERMPASLGTFKRFGIVTICLIGVLAVGVVVLPVGTTARVMAVSSTPSKPGSINGAAGSQQVSLTWGAVANATGYFIEQTDLVTGQVQQLPGVVTGTSSTVGSLAKGRWYRFRIIPVDGTVQGTPSDAIEIRTAGFRGSYEHYYVLGDSYSSGEGAPPYAGTKGCYRSGNSYAYHLGLGVPSPVMIACSGAVVDDIDKVTQLPNLPGTQLQQLSESALDNSLITLTIGGNDVGFAKDLEDCIFGLHACTSRRDAIAQKIVALEPRLVQVYQEIRKAAPGADIIVLGYPLLLAATEMAGCHNPIIKAGLSKSEMSMIRQLATQLDEVIAQAAAQAGVISVASQVEQAFAGHEVCIRNENNEWINEITGLKSMIHGSFHPKTSGYLADALAVNAGRTALYLSGMVRQG